MARLAEHAGERARSEERNNDIFNMEKDKGISADAGLSEVSIPQLPSTVRPLTVWNCKSAHVLFYWSVV